MPPLQDQELGDLLRNSIVAGVSVKALYWDQFLANLNKNDSYEAGHGNNVEIASVVNRTVTSALCYPAYDFKRAPYRATRLETPGMPPGRSRNQALNFIILIAFPTNARHRSSP